MKTLKNLSLLFMLIILATFQANASVYLTEDEQSDTTRYTLYTGRVIDAENRTPLPFATIEAEGVNISTVSNIDGDFTLKIPEGISIDNIKISYIGFKNAMVDVADYQNDKNNSIALNPSAVNLEEVTIRIEDASDLISEILDNIRKNYSTDDMMMRAFYRETTRKRRNYVAISEAVVDIYKAAYDNGFKNDHVKLIQGRKSADVEKMDTVMFKLQGGPVLTLMLDIMKNPYVLLSEEYKKVYKFYITGVISMNDRLHYVISFDQRTHVTTPFYNGKLYVDMEKLAITEAEFELNMKNKMEVASMFVKKKPAGMSVNPEKAAYRVKYTLDGNKWYFSYARGEVKFNVNWKRKLFNTSYTTMSEIAITDRSEEALKIPPGERFRRSEVLDELVYIFFDQDFWKGYNVIEPDQSIENAIKRLNKKYLNRISESS